MCAATAALGGCFALSCILTANGGGDFYIINLVGETISLLSLVSAMHVDTRTVLAIGKCAGCACSCEFPRPNAACIFHLTYMYSAEGMPLLF